MFDEERRNFILSNIKKLTTCTVIGPEFVVSLLESGLIDDAEKHRLLDTRTPNVTRAIMLYTETVNKWSSTQFEDFKRVLQETKNFNALEIFSNYDINATTPTATTTTKLLSKDNEQAPNKNIKNEVKQTNQHSIQPAKLNEADKVTTVVNNESQVVLDEVHTLKQWSSVIKFVRRLGSSTITPSKSENDAKGTTQTKNVALATYKTVGQKSPSSSSVFVRSRQIYVAELLKRITKDDLNLFAEKIEIAWKLARTFSQDDLYYLFKKEETRVRDKLGWPVEVSVCLGEEFVPRGSQLAEFRGKFGEDKGKTVFELSCSGCEFALEVLWDDLLREMDEGNDKGPVTAALREATGRLDGGDYSGWKLISRLEDTVKRRSRNACLTEQQSDVVCITGNCERSVATNAIRVMEWMTQNVYLLNEDVYPTPLEALPYLVRYARNVTPSRLRSILQGQKDANLLAVLRSLIILSSPSYPEGERCFSEVAAFLEENIQSIPPHLTMLTQRVIFSGEGDSKPVVHKNNSHHRYRLVRDVSVGSVFLRFIPKAAAVDKKTWEVVLADVIKQSPCCDIPSVLQELQKILASEKLREILTSYGVLWEWVNRFWSANRKLGDECDWCGLRHFLSFYFFVFGADNCEWMKEQNWILVKCLPVEISTVLQGEDMNKNDRGKNVFPQFKELLREFLGFANISFVGQVAFSLWYKSERDWDTLLNLIEEEDLLKGAFGEGRVFVTYIAAPLICVLMKMFGSDWTRAWLTTHHLLDRIPSAVKYGDDTVESFGSLLHSTIELGLLEQVKRRAWPGIISWRNSKGKTALEVAKETKVVEDKYRIIVQLEDLIASSLKNT